MKQQLTACPFCLGTGKVKKANYINYDELTAKKAVEMRRDGVSFREIGRKLGYKYPQSVINLINTWVKKHSK